MSSLFIGRESIIKRLHKEVFFVKEDSFGFCRSLIGPNGVGKTTLMKHILEDYQKAKKPHCYRNGDATFCFYKDIEEGLTFWSFWTDLIVTMSCVITEEEMKKAPMWDEDMAEEILATYEFFNTFKGKIDGNQELMAQAVTHLNEYFIYFTEMGIRNILLIDEFDRAKQVFEDGQFFQRLFGLTEKGTASLNLSIVTISRKSVSTIAHHMQEGSNFQDAFPSIVLKGFSNRELEAYFKTYEELPCGPLPEETRQGIICLCGRHPGLLMSVRGEIEVGEFTEVNIRKIYTESRSFITKTYERMITLLRDEKVDKAKSMPCMGIFIQQFIGPAYMEQLSDKMDRLYDYGIVTRPDEDEPNIYELSGMKVYRDCEKGLFYEPLSPSFVEYVKDHVVPEELNSLAALLEKTEREVRVRIQRGLEAMYPDTWQEIVDAIIPKKDDYLDKLREVGAQNNALERNFAFSKLNVLAFDDYSKIIARNWEILGPLFPAYATKEQLKKDMHVLNVCRNTSAHLNLEILNDASRRSLKEICEEILKDGGEGVVAENNEAGQIQMPSQPAVLPLGGPGGYAEGAQVTLDRLEVTTLGGLRGKIKGTEIGASLSKKYLQSIGISPRGYLGSTITVSLVRWDENAGKYNARWVG